MNAIRKAADYQQFGFAEDGSIIFIGDRMSKKLMAFGSVVEQHFKAREVLDIGCDMGFWSFMASQAGAKRVIGLDRNRDVRGIGAVDLVQLNRDAAAAFPVYANCEFYTHECGRQWHEFGRFDTVMLFSLYHHIYQATGGDHLPIWYWLRRHVKENGVVLWENPINLDDVVASHAVRANRDDYRLDKILEAASLYFDAEHIGHAGHEPHRHVFRFRAKPTVPCTEVVTMKSGAGGASKCFAFADGRRQKEVENILGYLPFAGSLNVEAQHPFDFDSGYFRAQVLDVVNRRDLKGLNQEWQPRWARFYPVSLNSDGRRGLDVKGHAFRFEGEKYSTSFVEILAPTRLRDTLSGNTMLTKE